MSSMEMLSLPNGMAAPRVGLGTWQVNDRELIKELLKEAYEAGYRLIDTAAAYSDEMAIGRAIADLELPRQEMCLSDKVWNTSRGRDAVIEACKKSLKKLKTDYLDIYLIHWPASPKLYPDWEEINADTWRGMEDLYKEGMVRAIGVCNFKKHHLEALRKTAEIMPMLNQFEMHPGMNQKELVQFCKTEKIAVESSSPLGNGQILQNEVLVGIAGKIGRTPAQVCLRWAIQNGAIVLPKTSKIERLKSNIELFDFGLDDAIMEQINNMPYCGGIGIDSDEVTEFG